MYSLNFGLWNATNLHIFRIPNINLSDTVLHLKLKIMGIIRNDEIGKIELLHCGILMHNSEKISTYVKNCNSILFVIRKEDSMKLKKEVHHNEELLRMLAEYSDAFSTPGFKEIILNAVKPETIKKLLTDIPELMSDSIALSILKDSHLLGTILKPSIMKSQIKKHPALIITVNYLVNNIVKETIDNHRIHSPIHLTDEDFSESDDIDIDYGEQFRDQHNFTYNPITVAQLADALRNNTSIEHTENQDMDMIELPLVADNVFQGAARDVLNNQTNEQMNVFNRTGLASQLRQMHELGLANDLLNFRALEVAEGDVQGAVELILNGIIE